jgi:hypothetical protein
MEWPSIAINLSPPASRSGSPIRKTRSSVLHPFQRKQKDHDNISTTDFALVPTKTLSHQHLGHDEKHSESTPDGSRGTSPMTRGISPTRNDHTETKQPDGLELQSTNDHRLGTASRVGTKTSTNTGADQSKVRGMFKGGRIAELVGHEVSRVGDFIWKREPHTMYKHRASTSDGSLRDYVSDTEQETQQNGNIHKTPPPAFSRSRSSTISSTKSGSLSPTISRTSPPTNERPRYNNPNLPSFTSPFQRDKEQQDRNKGLLNPNTATHDSSSDHISRQAAQQRSASRSPQLKMALPRLNTSGSSKSMEHQQTQGIDLDLSRPRVASNVLNNALDPISISELAVRRLSRATVDPSQTGGSETDQDPSPVSWRDIGRAEALLFSSAIKAREIARRTEDPLPRVPKYVLDSFSPETRALHAQNKLHIKKREQHVVAAKNLMETLDKYTESFTYKLHSFTTTAAPSLHTQLQTLEDTVEKTMTPQVRIAADEAGELSMKLTTASTLAVKGLNDSIEVASRRRKRGPLRMFRRFGFTLIEWGVVGLLWFIWAIVSFVQVVLGVGRGVGRGVRWLVWL